MYALMPVGNGRPSLLLIIQATALISSASLGLLPSGDASPLNPISYSRYGAAALCAGPASASAARAVPIQVRRAKAMAADIVRLRGVSRLTCSSGNLRGWFRLLKVRKENPAMWRRITALTVAALLTGAVGVSAQIYTPESLERYFRLEWRSEEHTSELQSRLHLVCRLLLEKKKKNLRYRDTGRLTTTAYTQ